MPTATRRKGRAQAPEIMVIHHSPPQGDPFISLGPKTEQLTVINYVADKCLF